MWGNGRLPLNFICPDPACGCLVYGEVENATYDSSADRESDASGHAETPIACEACGKEVTIVVDQSVFGKSVRVLEYPRTVVSYEEDFSGDYDEFLASYVPTEPYEIYLHAKRELDDFCEEHVFKFWDRKLHRRMVFTQYVSVMEAYLADRLIKLIISDESKLIAFIGGTKALREHSFSLIDLTKSPVSPLDIAKTYIQHQSLHALETVAAFYRPVLKFELFTSKVEESAATELIKIRHHLVHRNGRDNEGNEIEIGDEVVVSISNLVHDIVARVEGHYASYMAKKHFGDEQDG